MKKICAMIFAILMGVAVVLPLSSQPVYAAEKPDGQNCGQSSYFLGLRPWYHGLTVGTGGDCHAVTPTEVEGEEGLSLSEFIWTAVLNIMADLFIIGSLLAIGFLIWGGFKYIMSNGDPGHVQVAKKTISSAVVGLIITVLAAIIANTIIELLIAARNGGA